MTLPRSIVCLLLALATAAPAFAQTDTNAEIRIIAHAFDEAQQKGDRAVLDRMLAPDFLFVRANGQVGGKSDFIAGFTAPGHVLEPFRIVDPLFIRVSPEVAIAGGEAWLKGTDGGRPFARHFRYSDTFAWRDGKWVVVYTQVTALPAE